MEGAGLEARMAVMEQVQYNVEQILAGVQEGNKERDMTLASIARTLQEQMRTSDELRHSQRTQEEINKKFEISVAKIIEVQAEHSKTQALQEQWQETQVEANRTVSEAIKAFTEDSITNKMFKMKLTVILTALGSILVIFGQPVGSWAFHKLVGPTTVATVPAGEVHPQH